MEEKKIEETIEKTEEGLGKRNRLIDRAEFKLGLTIFIAGALLIIFYQIVAHYTGFKSGLVNQIAFCLWLCDGLSIITGI